jgi:thioesterase domain-containing protein/acyl carrier protein
LRAGWIGYPTLKMVCAATDLSPRLADQLTAMDGELWALYGIPELCTWYAIQRLKPHQPLAQIGEPIANTALYVLDSRMKIAPIGATGTLYIGGDGVADFDNLVTDPFNTGTGIKLYRTDGPARLRANGRIELLPVGAAVFVHRGRQIEPAEIEAELIRDPEIADAGVLQRFGASGVSTIVANVVLRRESTEIDADTVERIRNRLLDSLPHAMLPGTYAAYAALPRDTNGVLDRQALSRLRPGGGAAKDMQASGDIEIRLIDMWQSMLKVPSISVTDNFFEMGGHSLLAARMLTQIESTFGRRIPLVTLFAAPTIHELAKVLAQPDARAFDFRQMVKLQPGGSKPPLIAINNTGNYYLLAKYLGPDQPVISLQVFDPSTKSEHMPQTLEEVAAEYVQLIRRVQPHGPYNLMGWCVAGALAFEIARQLANSQQKVAQLFLMDSWVPRYIDEQPPLRRFISAYSLRWQLTWQDWGKARSVGEFIGNRLSVQKLKRLWSRLMRQTAYANGEDTAQQTSEKYDRWLLNYLQGLTAKYQPGSYDGVVTLFRSQKEPTGLFFDPEAGWGRFATAGVKLHMVTGDHLTMFQNKGAEEMADIIGGLIDRGRG